MEYNETPETINNANFSPTPETIVNAENKKKKPRIRDKSNHIAWGLGVLIIIGAVLKWTSFFANATIAEICTVGATCWSLCCAPISLNVTLEKFLNRVN